MNDRQYCQRCPLELTVSNFVIDIARRIAFVPHNHLTTFFLEIFDGFVFFIKIAMCKEDKGKLKLDPLESSAYAFRDG